jgi:hypothetical protein
VLRLSVIVLLVIAACGGGKSARMGGATPAAVDGNAAAASLIPASAREEIQALDDQNTAALAELKLEEPQPAMIESSAATPMGAISPQSDPKCRPAQTEQCTTSCTLSNSVCSNADKICTLAKDMVGDTWASNKCKRANVMCEAAHKKCCSCQ